MDDRKRRIEQMNTEISALMRLVADFLSIIPINKIRQSNTKTKYGKDNVEIACSISLFRGKYRKQD